MVKPAEPPEGSRSRPSLGAVRAASILAPPRRHALRPSLAPYCGQAGWGVTLLPGSGEDSHPLPLLFSRRSVSWFPVSDLALEPEWCSLARACSSGLGLWVADTLAGFRRWGGLGRLAPRAGGPRRPVSWSFRLGRVGMPGSSGTPLSVRRAADEGLEARGRPR